ncbi:hypothetical protein [Sabulibacter ruber]|uniref:hypothetical protein n=1 Tax=Sabulibacter ruber TaxID=2811901 RepID=UPI001A973744|nr:hypothetical protein [Sabulibacter ruber]
MKFAYPFLITLINLSLFSSCDRSEELPDCNDLYATYVHKWNDNPEHKIPIVKPDMIQSFKPDTYVSTLVDSTDKGYVKTKKQVEALISASRQDFQELANFNEFSLETIEKLDKAIDRQYIRSIIDASDVNDDSNQYMISIIEFGCALAQTMENEIGGFVWVYKYPYWESTLLHKKTGFEIPVFHWAIKKYSEYGVDDGFKDKILALKSNLQE